MACSRRSLFIVKIDNLSTGFGWRSTCGTSHGCAGFTPNTNNPSVRKNRHDGQIHIDQHHKLSAGGANVKQMRTTKSFASLFYSFILFISLSLFVSTYRETARSDSYDIELLDIEIISLGFIDNFKLPRKKKFKKHFVKKVSEIDTEGLLKITFERGGIEQTEDNRIVFLNLYVKEVCDSASRSCAFAVFPERFWSGGDVAITQCLSVQAYDVNSKIRRPEALSAIVADLLQDCLVGELITIKK